jgi:predicted transport protein
VGRRPTLSADGKVDQPFSDINDPKGICKDVSRLGRWSNGDVEVRLSSIEDLPYVMVLVRQSFKRQMGNNGDDH